MSWLSDFLGLKKVRTPAVPAAPEIESDDALTEDYLKMLSRRQGFTNTILTGRKKLGGMIAQLG